MTGFVRTLVRRWYLTIAGLLLTVALCVVATAVVKPTYEATASVLLLPPATSVGVGGNPYLQLGGLTQVVDVLARALATREMGDTVTAKDSRAQYTAAADVTTRGPILLLTATAPTGASSLSVLDTLLRQAPATLAGLQTDLSIAARSQITSMVLIRDTEPTPIQKTRIRILVAVAALGIVLTIFGVALLDALFTRRSTARRNPKQQVAEDSLEIDAPLRSAPSFPPIASDAGASSPGAPGDPVAPPSRRAPRMRPAATPESESTPGRPVAASTNGQGIATGALASSEPDETASMAPASFTTRSGDRSGLRLR